MSSIISFRGQRVHPRSVYSCVILFPLRPPTHFHLLAARGKTSPRQSLGRLRGIFIGLP